MKRIPRAIDVAVDKIVTPLAAVALIVACGSCAFQVTARFVLNMPAAWTESLTRVSLIWMVFFGLAAGFRQGIMPAIDIVHTLATGAPKRILTLVNRAACFVFLAVLVFFGAILAWRLRFQNLAGLDIPISWAYLAVPVGALCAFAALSARPLAQDEAARTIVE